MSEVTVQFRNSVRGYNKQEVNDFLKNDIEVRLQQKSVEIANLQKQVSELEAKLEAVTGGDANAEEKLDLYDKLMKKMNGDYENLLAPAIAKAKEIEENAVKESEIRMSQVRIDAEGLYEKTSDKIAGAVSEKVTESVDQNMDRIYEMMDEYVRSKSLATRFAKVLHKIGDSARTLTCAVRNVVLGQVKE